MLIYIVRMIHYITTVTQYS